MTIHRTHVVAALLILSLVGNVALVFFLWSTRGDLDETETTLRASEQAETRLTEEVSTCESTKTLSGNVVRYLGQKISELDDILIATDNAAVDFITWCSENGTFYGDNFTDGNRRHAAWLTKQEQTNKDYEALTQEIRDFLSELEGAAATQDSGIQHAF